MNVFELRNRLVKSYGDYIRSFILIRDPIIRARVEAELNQGLLWPETLIQLNPSFEPGATVDQLVDDGVLHDGCRCIFRIKPEADSPGRPLRLHRHQEEAVRVARGGENYVLTTGTGSGKSLSYIVPIVDHVLRRGPGCGIQAIVVYPMNALANSQAGELRKFLQHGFPDCNGPVKFACYTGQETDEQKRAIVADPPDILLTNYVMLELVLTRPQEVNLVQAAQGLSYLVLDELHTYRGRQGSDVALLVRRVRQALNAPWLQCVGTSATLASSGSYDEQRAQVATVASDLFGAKVRPEHVIGETLRRATREIGSPGAYDPAFLQELTRCVADPEATPPRAYADFVADPLSSWIESTFGLQPEPGTGRLVRARPRSITGDEGAAVELNQLTGQPVERCAQAIRDGLLGGYQCERNPETGFPAFAFRLHQFISRGDTVYATVEPESKRHVTLQGQQFVPGDRGRVLLPLVFCRECGQEYYAVRAMIDPQTGDRVYVPSNRDVLEGEGGGEVELGYLHVDTKAPWPSDPLDVVRLVPEDWIEEHRGAERIRPARQKDVPRAVRIGPDGRISESGVDAAFVPAPFRFCLHCGVSYGTRSKSDFGKLATLSSEGRSTATTILGLTAVRALRSEPTLPEKARKLLSFTDNRQDASLQAGHFNDFVEISLLRAALYRAVAAASPGGLTHEYLTQRVFDALALPIEQYASNPGDLRFALAAEAGRALRDVLGYRIYRDLRRGWRVTSPNLEQCGLLEIRYQSLDELCAAEDVWERCHPALARALPGTRVSVARALLDFLRRSLAIKVDYLERTAQERLQLVSNQKLIPPWGLDENESLEYASVVYPRPGRGGYDDRSNLFLSPRGGFGLFLGRRTTFPHLELPPGLEDRQQIIRELLEALRIGGLVEIVDRPRSGDEVPGYQLSAAALLWVAGDGRRAFHDPITMPSAPDEGGRANPFFVDYYRTVAGDLAGLSAREHTAQVPYEERNERENQFREGRLPVLFCSPTMELGVDISELNVVNLRNVPPTPANYAQRSGRAGRSGQPALVFTYCATGSPHDQYFFRRPERMVAGAVRPPRMDLGNEDLIRSHVHAIWLAETGQSLGTSLRELLDLNQLPELPLLDHVRDQLHAEAHQRRARARAAAVLETLGPELKGCDWYTPTWLDEALAQAPRRFNEACERWRGLYRAAIAQRDAQHRIIADASRSAADKSRARLLRREAESQIELLTEASNVAQADFYSYRYFASEGFLPGYNFPRLPLSAYIPARGPRQSRDEFVSRPRFLAITEFGPRSIVYHEGSRYQINRVILPVREGDQFATEQAKLCARCGFLHPIPEGDGPDTCEHCKTRLPMALAPLFRLQNVSTKRREKINSDEEERRRLGYEIQTGVRFAEYRGQPSCRTAEARVEDRVLASLSYGQAATLWRINLGENRRRNPNQFGFVLDIERGYWAKSEQASEDEEDQDPMTPRTARVIPYVEDRRNALLLEFAESQRPEVMASLQAALKSAIQVQFQLEDSELAAEPLPSRDERRQILFYESAEGGAGVLRRLIDEPDALGRVAREALEICHFDPDTGQDRRRGLGAREDCEAACYDCLMSYFNQPDHALLDRKAARPILEALAGAKVAASPVGGTRESHLERLYRLAGSELERDWLRFLDLHGHRLPSTAQELIAKAGTRPDFTYADHHAVIYIDGPVHDYPERQARDATQQERLEDLGFTVIRFGHRDDWAAIVARHPSIFGSRS